ncbi:MAG: TrkH family potassium uptake protein, partial [Bacteroidales bacterium]|nr:TrkH family potassium uptake protein [Bacteroidales bacterium]
AIQCGCSGSTTGGLKVDRVVIAFKAIMNELRHKLHPTSVSRLKMGRQYLPDSMIGAVCLYIVLYMIVVLISCILVMLTGVEAMEAVSGTFASIGNIGPGLDKVSAMCNYSMQPVMAKLIFTFDMFLGRLEIFPVLIVLSFIFKRDR